MVNNTNSGSGNTGGINNKQGTTGSTGGNMGGNTGGNTGGNMGSNTGSGSGGMSQTKFVPTFEMAIMQFVILNKAQQGEITKENIQSVFKGNLQMSSNHLDHCLQVLVQGGHLKSNGNKYTITDDGREDVQKIQHLVLELPQVVNQGGNKQGMTQQKSVGQTGGASNLGGSTGTGSTGGSTGGSYGGQTGGNVGSGTTGGNVGGSQNQNKQNQNKGSY